MGVPIEKRLENAQKALLTRILDGGKSFNPNNPEDVKKQKEIAQQVEAMQSISSLVTDPTGGGLTGMTRVISKAFGAKAAKALFKQNKAKQIADLVTKPMTRGKKAVSNTRKQAAPIVKEVVETKPTIPTTIPSTMELAQIPGSSVKTIKESVKSFKGTKGTFTPRDTERVAKAREILNQPIAGNMRPSTIPQGFKSPFANTSLRPYINTKGNPFDFNKFKLDGDVINKPLANVIEGAALVGKGAMVTGGLGVGSALFSSENRISSPVDLKRIDKSKLKDSNIEGVKTIRGSDGKDYGIKWNNTTKSWDYYRGDKTKKTETPKPDLKREDVGGGYTPIKDNKGSGTGSGGKTTTGGGTGTTPRSTTAPKTTVDVGKTTAPLIGDEYYKKDPRLATLRQQDDDRQLLARAEAQKKEMESKIIQPLPTKPLSELVFKTTAKAAESQKIRNSMDEQNALRSIIADNRMPLKKKRYGGNLAMLKYMKQ